MSERQMDARMKVRSGQNKRRQRRRVCLKLRITKAKKTEKRGRGVLERGLRGRVRDASLDGELV